MKKIKIAVLGFAALITGASAFSVKHTAKNKFVKTYYVLATSSTWTGLATVYHYHITRAEKICITGPYACAVHIPTPGYTVMTYDGINWNTWINKANVLTLTYKM